MKPIPDAPRLVKIDTTSAGQPGEQWLEVHEVLPEGAAQRVRVRMPDGEIREFSLEEVGSWRA